MQPMSWLIVRVMATYRTPQIRSSSNCCRSGAVVNELRTYRQTTKYEVHEPLMEKWGSPFYSPNPPLKWWVCGANHLSIRSTAYILTPEESVLRINLVFGDLGSVEILWAHMQQSRCARVSSIASALWKVTAQPLSVSALNLRNRNATSDWWFNNIFDEPFPISLDATPYMELYGIVITKTIFLLECFL